MSDLNWVELYEWVATDAQFIWHNVTTGKYHWEDEANLFDETGYPTIEACKEALNRYITKYL